ncbi:MAG: hypothetical protein OSJ62_12200 [Lachnospiraceae bacterium]|nr:hypothetical protein [Lachnospiraceae bacterium]
MTNKEKYKQAFSVLHSPSEITMEVERMAIMKKKKFRTAAAAVIMIGLLMAGTSGMVYAADIGGIQRTIQLWIEGDQTDVTFEYHADGSYYLSYPVEDSTTEGWRGGGVAIEEDGKERPLTEQELLEELNYPTVKYKEDGTIWVYYYDQEIEITDQFQDEVCYVKVSNGKDTLYMTILYQDGWSTSPHKYVEAEDLR